MKTPLITRRSLLHATGGAGLLLLGDSFAFGASDFWTKKQPAEWSADEIKVLKTKSPWAKKVRGEMSGGGPGGGGPGGGSGGLDAGSSGVPGTGRGPNLNAAGLPGRGLAGGDDAPPGGAGPQAPEVIIRWESAKPLAALEKEPFPHELQDRYVISMTGLPPQMILLGLGRGGRGRGRGEAGTPPPQPGVDPRRNEIMQILSETTLTVKGHDPQNAAAMMRTQDSQTYLFGFPRENLPIALSDKEAVFQLKLGVLTIKAKFELKDMMFDGQLAV
jgi:hypothetical protein